ncbi:acyl carrier protein [Streptomyces sp. NPDC052101]|uniref:acyl carrier protein n=1 Tax=Streptomyces sp. NPDC052101 TaxID=3155763 RepID=UPI003413FCEA
MIPAATDPTVVHLRGWLTERMAVYLRQAPADIGAQVPLATYGLDSVVALSLCGDVEDEFGIVLDPTVAWDYPTIEELADHLAGLVPQLAPVTAGLPGSAVR